MRFISGSLACVTLALATATSPPAEVKQAQCPSVNAGFDQDKVIQVAVSKSKAAWEYGTTAEALIELYNPELAVFSSSAFPGGKVPSPDPKGVQSLSYVQPHISTTTQTLWGPGDTAAGDPASMGVSAILLGQSNAAYYQAALREKNYLFNNVPRLPNGAISHRTDSAQAWSDWMYMVPPFLAYQAVRDNNVTLLRVTVQQIGLYRAILQDHFAKSTATTTLWEHILPSKDPGNWSTGNGWAAMGMARVLATIVHSPLANGLQDQQQELTAWIKEILDSVIAIGPDSGTGLLRNYINDSSYFGETSGSALLAATMYRMAVLVPGQFASSKYTNFADALRTAVSKHVGSNGILSPAVDPYAYLSHTPYSAGSPEGQAFGAMLYAAYRDYKCAM